LFGTGQPQHPLQKPFQTLQIFERALETEAIFLGLARTLQQRLQGGFQHRDRGLQFVRGIPHKFSLLGKRALEPLQHVRHGPGERA
jgi:hypothetical protein